MSSLWADDLKYPFIAFIDPCMVILVGLLFDYVRNERIGLVITDVGQVTTDLLLS